MISAAALALLCGTAVAQTAAPPASSSSTAPGVVSSTPTPAAVASSTPSAPAAPSSAPGVPAVIYSTPTVPAVVLSTAPNYGPRMPPSNGPWVLGDVQFSGSQAVSDYALRAKVRARRGSLYTPNDIAGDVQALQSMGLFSKVDWGLYAMDEPVPSQYSGIVVSTSLARLVFFLSETGTPQAVPALPAPVRPEDRVPPAAVSGVVLTPTAYRGLGHFNRPGLGLDFNGVYYIGRLYGKTHVPYTTHQTNYLDRIGLWFLQTDGKMQLQSEGTWRPAMAAGVQGILMFRDAPQPSITTPGVTVNVSEKTTRALADAYLVFSKKTGPVRESVGYMQGNFGDAIGNLTEFLSPQALELDGHPNQAAQSKSMFFASLLALPKPAYPLAVEIMKPNGMALSPYLLNFKIGYFLHLNFDVSYLKYNGGWDLLGTFQFRYNYFPSR